MRFTSFGTFVICAALALVAPSRAVPVAQVNTLDAAVRPVSFIPTNSNGSAVLPASAAAPSASPVANPVSFIPVGGSGSPILPRVASPGAAELQRRELETLLTRMLNEKRVTENDLINLMLVARSGDTKH